MFERFTDRARRVIVLAQDESRSMNHNYIGTEHILLALLAEKDGVAGQMLIGKGLTQENTRAKIIEIVGEGNSAPGGHIPFTPRTKKMLEQALREALQLGHSWIGTEHLLLSLIRDNEHTGATIMSDLGVKLDLNEVRSQVAKMFLEDRNVNILNLHSLTPIHPGLWTALSTDNPNKQYVIIEKKND